MPREKKEKTPNERTPSAAELAARARGMKGNTEMAEQFGVNADYPRELVKVDHLPDPPRTEMVQRKDSLVATDINEIVAAILQDAADEITERFAKFGIAFTSSMRQDMIDHLSTLLALQQQGMMVGGGAIARR